MREVALNTFQGGLVMDDHPLYQRNGSYSYLLNGRKLLEDSFNFGVSNALSNTEFSPELGEIVGATLVEERDYWIVFSRNGGATIYTVSTIDGSYKEVINLASCGVDFSSCENIYAEMKDMEPCSELFIYFSSRCFYYVLNIDALLDPKRKDDYECDDFLLFNCVCVPELDTQISSAAGGNLQAGAYRFVIQLEDEDGNSTNWFNITYPLSIESENNIAGELSRKTIRITLTNLDPRYHKLNLAVIKNIGGKETYEVFPTFHYSGSSFTYEYYGQEGEGILLEEILTKRRTYIKGKDLIQKDNTLLLYNILQRRNLDYQRRANNIHVSGVLYVSKAEDAHKFRTMIRGERYLPAIGWQYCSSEKTVGFVLSNFGGSSDGAITIPDNSHVNMITPRSSSEGSGSDTHDTTTLEDSRAGDENNIDNPDGVTDDSKNDIDNTLNGSPDTEVDPCVGCGSDSGQDLVNFGDTFTTNIFDNITNESRRGRLRKKNKIKSTNLKNSIFNMLEELKSLDDDPEENKEVYEVTNYTPVSRLSFDKSTLEEVLGEKDLAKLLEFEFKTFESSQVYPLTKDCMGEYIYGSLAGQPIRLLEVPSEAEIPFFVSFQNGVKSQKTLGVDEFEDAYCFFIGIKVDNVEFPVDDELHTPLCEETPYSIYFAETTPVNRRIVAKGIMPHTFSGQINGKEYAIPKHAVNSIEHVDRHIQNGDDKNHMGQPHNVPIFTFHSPDTSVGKPLLNVDNAFIPGDLFGTGWMHGQYAFGEEPTSTLFGRQKDQRGVRQSVNLNKTNFVGEVEIPVSGLTFAQGNKAITNANGIDLSLCNLYRESSVFMQLESMPPPLGQGVQGGYADYSFIGQGLNHSCRIPYAAAHYTVLRNEIPDQYGSVESLIYIDSGLTANGNQSSIEGICGDGFIGPWTIKRTSYVSNKVGDNPILPSRRRVGSLLQYFGFGDCTRPPDSGDDRDPKNKANLHPDQGCGIRPGGPDTDLFFPRTLSTMVAFWVESRVNVWYRATGVETGQVFYPKLKDLFLDSSVPNGSPWPESWLNRFHCLVNRASKFLIIARAAIRLIVFFYGLYLAIDSALTVNSLIDTFLAILRAVIIFAIWAFAFFYVFTNRNINKLFGLDECLDDRQGAQDHEQIRGWEDNYFDYNFDYSIQNRYNFVIGVPDPYNVCDCDDCESNQVTHEIFISNPQVVGSPIDAYKNFQANSYLIFPLDHGKITKIIDFQGRLIAHTTDSLQLLSYKHSIQFEDGNLALANGGYISHPEMIGGFTPEGSYGLQNPMHSLMFPGGYVFIDEKATRIWLMTSLGSLREISNIDNKAFFATNIPLCNDGDCKGEGVPNEVGYSLGYDPVEDLLYITKKDGCGSFTISYDLERNRWFSFHSFIPQRYLATRTNMFTVQDGQIWLHNYDKSNHQVYYNKFYPHVLEIVSKKNILTTSELDSFSFYTQAIKQGANSNSDVYNLKETFNKGVFYNNTQSSGELQFKVKSDGLPEQVNFFKDNIDYGPIVPVTWQGEEWRVNRIRDYVDNVYQPLWVSECDCAIDKSVNQANINYNRIHQTPNIIYDRFMKVRLYYDIPSAQSTKLITHFTLANNNQELQ